MADASPAIVRIKELLAREVTAQEYDLIRTTWFTHVDNEEQLFTPHSPAEGERYLDAVMETLTDDCLFRFPNGDQWTGQVLVREFYHTLLEAFENMVWTPQTVVVGPQGVLDFVTMSAVMRRPLGGLACVGESVRIRWLIEWPWDPIRRKFTGEIVHIYDRIE